MDRLDNEIEFQPNSIHNPINQSQNLPRKAHKLYPEIQELFVTFLERLGLAWWIEIVTENPACTYYFGPFVNVSDARLAQEGYLEDLVQEGATGIQVTIKRCRPETLTIFEQE